MTIKNPTINWVVNGASVKGAKHKRNDLDNQDAIKWGSRAGNLVLAVSDGHGSLQHFRSKSGAEFAVEAAVEIILEEADVEDLTSDVKGIKERVREKLPRRIVNRWQEKVDQHYNSFPFKEDKLAEIEIKKGKKERDKLENDYFKAYGTTLLAVLITGNFVLYLQLGDGSIITIEEGEVVNRVFSIDEAQFGNDTHSLCMSNCENHFKIKLVTFKVQKPMLILASTDGYENSFRDENDFLKVGGDLFQLIKKEGLNYINNNLEEWLYQTSLQGSGDDVTAGFICRQEIIKPDRNLGEQLIEAIKQDASLEKIEGLLLQGADVNYKTASGRTPLMVALCKNYQGSGKDFNCNKVELIKLLLRRGAKINQEDRLGLTPLMLAARNCSNPEIITLLIEAGADVDKKHNDDEQALDFALRNSSLKDTKALQLLKEKTSEMSIDN